MKAFELVKEIDSLMETIASNVDENAQSETWKRWLNAAAAQHRYSWHNQVLIVTHFPEATLVMGFNQWKKHNRFVKKGEKGIPILFPMWIKDKEKADDHEGSLRFKVGYVFDISQTDGEPMPDMEYNATTDDHQEIFDQLMVYCNDSGIAVRISDAITTDGSTDGKSIILSNDLSVDAKAAVLLHEIAHIICQHKERKLKRQTKEIEAESVAYVMGKILGLPVDGAAIYLTGWEATGKDIKESFTQVSKAVSQIYKDLVGIEESEQTIAAD